MSEAYVCLKCWHKVSQTRKDFSRVCNKCSYIESVTANTLIHKVKFGVRKAFFNSFEMNTITKSLSSSFMAERFGVTEKRHVFLCIKYGKPWNQAAITPWSCYRGKEKGKVGRSFNSKKKKVVCAMELNEEGKIKRMYSLKIDDYSAKELKNMFVAHRSPDATVTADLW